MCRRPMETMRKSGCRLLLTSLPAEDVDARRNVVIVDGPSGAGPASQGRWAPAKKTSKRRVMLDRKRATIDSFGSFAKKKTLVCELHISLTNLPLE